jgi:hypothetical protein
MAEWAVTTANASLEFDTVNGGNHSCYQIDSNHFIDFWGGADYDGFVQVFTVNTSTWAVTTANASLEFDTVQGYFNSCYQIDSNHFIDFWCGSGSDGYVQVFTVNTSTWAVTTANASLEFDTVNGNYNSCYQIDSNHFIDFWGGADYDGFVQVFTVNTSTWAVTTANASLEFDTRDNERNSCYQIDSNHFINFWGGYSVDGYVQVFEVELPSGAVQDSSERAIHTIGGGTTSSERDIYSKGVTTSSSERLIHTIGSVDSSSERSLYSKGGNTGSSDRLLYSKGKILQTSDRLIYSEGKIPEGQGESDRLIYTKGVSTSSSERNLHSIGGGITSSERLLYTVSEATSDSARGLFTKGVVSSSSDRLLYEKGIASSSSDRTIYSEGVDTDNTSERNLYTKGVASSSSERNLYSGGGLTADSDRLVYSKGKTTASSDRGLYSKSGTTETKFKRWNGSEWVAVVLKRYNGSSWDTVTIKRYNGSTWEDKP